MRTDGALVRSDLRSNQQLSDTLFAKTLLKEPELFPEVTFRVVGRNASHVPCRLPDLWEAPSEPEWNDNGAQAALPCCSCFAIQVRMVLRRAQSVAPIRKVGRPS
jgi:hypothetical protein